MDGVLSYKRIRCASYGLLPLAALLVSTLPALPAAAQTPDDAAIRKILQDRVHSERATGLVVRVLDGDAKRVISYGSSGTDRPLDGDTVEIGSITKVFTAALLSDITRRGEVKLDDPISKYLPGNVRAPSRNGRHITLVDLATQTSGLPRLPDTWRRAIRQTPTPTTRSTSCTSFSPDTRSPATSARSTSTRTLASAFSAISSPAAGSSYEQLLTKRILIPLQMPDTAITLSPAMRGRLAAAHDESGAPVSGWDLPALAGAGALRSTVHDMLKILATNLGKGDPAIVAVLSETHGARHATGQPGLEIALAWHVLHPFGGELVCHNGGTGGFHSWIGFASKKRVGAVVLSNSAGDIDDIGIHIVEPRFPLSAPIWPAQVAGLLLGAGILIALLRRRTLRSRWIAAILAACWLFVAMAFHAHRYATITWAAVYFAWAFGAQAALLAWIGIVRGRLPFDSRHDARSRAGLVIFVFALLVEPVVIRSSAVDGTGSGSSARHRTRPRCPLSEYSFSPGSAIAGC